MEEPWINPGRWHISPFNFIEDVISKYEFPANKRVFVVDSTFRKIQELPGAPIPPKLSSDDIVEIATKLDEIGVAEIAINLYGLRRDTMRGKSIQMAKTIAEQGLKSKLLMCTSVLPDNWREEVDACIDSGADIIEVTQPGSDISLKMILEGFKKTGTTSRVTNWERLMERQCEATQYCKDRGVEAATSLQDSSRTEDLNRLIKIYNKSIESGASYLNFIDAWGTMTPDTMRFLIKKIRKNLIKEVPISVHVHNDYGQASVVVIAAVTAGAGMIDTSVNGLGFKGGLTPLGETVTALEVLYGVSTGIKLEALYDLSRLVEDKTGIRTQPNISIIGLNSFVYESEGDVLTVLEGVKEIPQVDYYVTRACAPEVVGQKRRVVWGVSTLHGPALRKKLEKMGLKYEEEDIDKIISVMKERLEKMNKYPIWLEETEVEEICKKYCKKYCKK